MSDSNLRIDNEYTSLQLTFNAIALMVYEVTFVSFYSTEKVNVTNN